MNQNQQELRIGTMVLAAIVCLVLMIVFLNKGSLLNFGGGYHIVVEFERAPGIKRNSPVFKNGVQIGHVSRVELTDQDRMVNVTVLIDKKYQIYNNEECRIKQTVMMSDTSLEFSKKKDFTGIVKEIDTATIISGEYSAGIVDGFGSIEGDLTKAIQSVSAAADNLGGFIERLNTVLGTPQEYQERQKKIEAIFNETRTTMSSFRSMTDGINEYVHDPKIKSDVKKVIDDLPATIDASRMLIGDASAFVRESRTLVEKAGGSIETLKKLSDQIGGDAPEILAAVKNISSKMSAFFEDLSVILKNVQSSDGTLKRLMREPAVYDSLLTTLSNIEKITAETDNLLQTEGRPIAANVRLLTDKAARDPAVFIRNLLKKEPPVKSLPQWGDGLGSDGVCFGECKDTRIGKSFANPAPIRHITQPVQCSPEVVWGMGAKVNVTGIETRSLTANGTVVPPEGRIVNIDPRYPEIMQASYLDK